VEIAGLEDPMNHRLPVLVVIKRFILKINSVRENSYSPVFLQLKKNLRAFFVITSKILYVRVNIFKIKENDVKK
jgi:hypothetical protein